MQQAEEQRLEQPGRQDGGLAAGAAAPGEARRQREEGQDGDDLRPQGREPLALMNPRPPVCRAGAARSAGECRGDFSRPSMSVDHFPEITNSANNREVRGGTSWTARKPCGVGWAERERCPSGHRDAWGWASLSLCPSYGLNTTCGLWADPVAMGRGQPAVVIGVARWRRGVPATGGG